jgi:hypothetical protein
MYLSFVSAIVIPYVTSMIVAESVLAHKLPHTAERNNSGSGSLSEVMSKFLGRIQETRK